MAALSYLEKCGGGRAEKMLSCSPSLRAAVDALDTRLHSRDPTTSATPRFCISFIVSLEFSVENEDYPPYQRAWHGSDW